MLVEDRPISLDFVNILILLLTLSRNINAITFFHLNFLGVPLILQLCHG
jgi:hypothetical protein